MTARLQHDDVGVMEARHSFVNAILGRKSVDVALAFWDRKS